MNKVQLIGNVNCFLLIRNGNGTLATSFDLTTASAYDIVSWLPGFASQFSFKEQFKEYELLEGYSQLINGWVKYVRAWSCNEKLASLEW